MHKVHKVMHSQLRGSGSHDMWVVNAETMRFSDGRLPPQAVHAMQVRQSQVG